MTAENLDPDEAERLRRKYINLEPTLENAAIIAEAEQHERAIREARAAVERYNEEHGLEWINWELPIELRQRVYQVRDRIREAQRRDAREGDGPPSIWYDDDRNKFDEADGWPAYNPDNPHHQTVPFGTVVGEPEHLYVLRGGTDEPVFPYGPNYAPDDAPDYGPAYDFDTFFKSAEQFYKTKQRWLRICDMQLSCFNGTGGGKQQLVAVALGQHIYVLSICAACTDALFESFRSAHPKWRKRRRPGTPPGP